MILAQQLLGLSVEETPGGGRALANEHFVFFHVVAAIVTRGREVLK